MHASKLINSIYSILNEDKFSKYTIKQIYDELGEEGFIEYIEDLCQKAIKLNVPNKKFKLTIRNDVYPNRLVYTSEVIISKDIEVSEIFVFSIYTRNFRSLVGQDIIDFRHLITVSQGSDVTDVISSFWVTVTDHSYVGISNLIKKEVGRVYSMPKLVKARKKYGI